MNRPIILIVEDNFDNMTLLKLLMEQQNFVVLTAYNGQFGMEVARNNHPDLIVLDIDMPIVSGWEMLQELKKEPELMNIPVVVVTAKLLTGDHTQVFEAGATGYVSKPFTVTALMNEIKRCLEIGAPQH